MKRILLWLMAVLAVCLMLAACGKKEQQPAAEPTPSAEPTPTPTPTPPPYLPNLLTGAARDANYAENQRPLAVMINNITQARPQYGLSKADIIAEIEVEGGITRLMAIFQDYKSIGEVGPIRSARIQYFELIAPWEMIYVHDGENDTTVSPLVVELGYEPWNLGGANTDNFHKYTKSWKPEDLGFGYRLNRTNWNGKSLDSVHREFISGEKLADYLERSNTDTQRDYNTGTFFNFVDYRLDNPVRDLGNSMDSNYVTEAYGPIVRDATYAEILHNENEDFRTRFFYNSATNTYDMEQWYSASGYGGGNQWIQTVDAADNTPLTFTNLVLLFTQIDDYPGTKGVKRVDYVSGGVGYYFYGGKCERIFWQKGNPQDRLQLFYADSAGKDSQIPLEINIGKTYLSVLDLDCYDWFAEKTLSEGAGTNETRASRTNVGSGTTLRGAAPAQTSSTATATPVPSATPAPEDPVVSDPVVESPDTSTTGGGSSATDTDTSESTGTSETTPSSDTGTDSSSAGTP